MLNKQLLNAAVLCFFSIAGCDKSTESTLHYYQVQVKDVPADWRDSAFIIATRNPKRVAEAEAQLKLPVAQRQIVSGGLLRGSGGYNKNAGHSFRWRFNETDWKFTDVSVEIYDGRPYSDVDTDTAYWFQTMKRFAPWNSYVAKEVSRN